MQVWTEKDLRKDIIKDRQRETCKDHQIDGFIFNIWKDLLIDREKHARM